MAMQMPRLAQQATGPYWHRTVAVAAERVVPSRDPAKREFAASFSGLAPDEEIVGQGTWDDFYYAPYPVAITVPASGPYSPGLVAVGSGNDSWAAAWHCMILDPARDIVLQMDARLPDPGENNSSFELYLNQAHVHADRAFGIALV